MKKYDKAVFIGRMQPLHNGHLINIVKCIELSNVVYVVIGSGKAPRSIKNPFSDRERTQMIVDSIKEYYGDKIVDFWFEDEHLNIHFQNNEFVTIIFRTIMDRLYSDNDWIENVQAAVAQFQGEKVVQVGHDKDSTGVHLEMFPQWDFYDSKIMYRHNGNPYHSSDFRKEWFESEEFPESWKDCIPKSVIKTIKGFDKSNLVEEYNYLKEYPEKWGKGPFVTTDAVVIVNGHVLMITRGANPGKGNYALPGGFLEPTETVEDGMIRELKEETKIKVPPAILKSNIQDSKVFDHPNRSLRGRIITFAYYIKLDNAEGLPNVKGADDADKAEWVPLSKLDSMTRVIHEDHYSIIRYFC